MAHDLESFCRKGDPFEALRDAAGADALHVVDGGANKGRVTARLLSLFPRALVTAYEPQPRLARKLDVRFAAESRVLVRQAGLGSAPGTLSLNVLESPTCSSFLSPAAIREKHAGKPMDVTQVVEVPVVRLEDDLSSPAQALKLDLQGYELEALKGAAGVLDGFRAVLCEVSFRELYAAQPLGEDVIGWMLARGFRLLGLYSPWRDEGGALVAADALFARE